MLCFRYRDPCRNPPQNDRAHPSIHPSATGTMADEMVTKFMPMLPEGKTEDDLRGLIADAGGDEVGDTPIGCIHGKSKVRISVRNIFVGFFFFLLFARFFSTQRSFGTNT